MRHLALIYCILSITNCISQTDYFNIYKPYEEWIQVSGGGVQIELDESGYRVVCTPTSGDGYGFGILDLDINGQYLDSKFFETNGLTQNFADSYLFTSDQSSLYCGDRENNQWVVKFDQNDSILWEHLFPYNFDIDEIFTKFVEVSDGYIFGGRLTNNAFTENSLFLFRTETDGTEVYLNYYNLEDMDYATVDDLILLDSENEVLVSAKDRSNAHRLLVKINADGTFEDNSQNVFLYNEDSPNQNAGKVLLNSEGKVVLAYTKVDIDSWNGDEDFNYYHFAITVLDPITMEPVQEEIISEELYFDPNISDFVQTPDGGYAILGTDASSIPYRGFIKKYNANFQEEWMNYYEYDIPEPFLQILDDFEVTSDGGFICAGNVSSFNQDYPQNIWILKLDACGDTEWQGCTSSVSEFEVGGLKFDVYPNPAQDVLTLELDQITFGQQLNASLRNTLGQEVFVQDIYAAHSELDVSKVPPGVYVVSLVSDGRELSSRRVVVE